MSPSEYSSFVAERFIKRAVGAEGLVHAGIGMLGELIEFRNSVSRDNQVEEVGDFEFYFAAAHIALGIQWRPESEPSMAGGFEYVQASLLSACEQFLDAAKKCWVYSREIQLIDFQGPLWKINQLQSRVCAIIGVDRWGVVENNMAKLKLRYPTGYSDALAAERKDKA